MPSIRIDDKHERYLNLLASVKGLEPIPTAVAHPSDVESLKGPVIAFQEGIIEPFLIGPESKIRSVAEEFGIDLHGIRIVHAAHSHDSAALAVSLVRTGDAEALMFAGLPGSVAQEGSRALDPLLRGLALEEGEVLLGIAGYDGEPLPDRWLALVGIPGQPPMYRELTLKGGAVVSTRVIQDAAGEEICRTSRWIAPS